MNVFEDLIVELKEENLLESTIIDSQLAATEANPFLEITEEPNPPAEKVTEAAFADNAHDAPTAAQNAKSGREFFKKRAIAEVSSLQMVEHVLTGVERECLQIVPKPFDDFNAKKALNCFLQVSADASSEEHKKAEADLIRETEAWATAIGERDRKVPVSSLRQYCENTKPALSSQALLALGRFYRNSAYSEAVRAKFDFVITRLFSRTGPGPGRSMLFEPEETLHHITRLYADWASVPLYTADTDDSKVLLTALGFGDLATEAESTPNCDQLIETDFFGRLRLYKESVSETFYAPNVTAAAIECNIRIGNAYVKLVEVEHKKLNAESIAAKFGDMGGETVSDAAAWTLDLAEIIRRRAEAAESENAESEESTLAPQQSATAKTARNEEDDSLGARLKDQLANVSKGVLAFCALLLLAAGALWFWANYYAGEEVPTTNVHVIETSGTPLAEHIKTAKVSGDTFYGLLNESWDALPKEKRTEFLQACLVTAQQSGAKQVQLIDKTGKQAGYASATKVDVSAP